VPDWCEWRYQCKNRKIQFLINGNYNQRKSISTGKTERTSLIGTPNTFLTQNDRSETEGSMRGVRGGFDYFLNNRNTISVSGNAFRGGFSPFSQSDILIVLFIL
jgi:hypothetical protein